jgi:Fibronectin type III domain
MNPNLGQAVRSILRLGGLVIVAAYALTVLTSVPAGAQAPRIKKPGAPTAVTAVPLGGGAELSWPAPTSDGGSPITSYLTTASHGGQTCSTTDTTTCTVSGLTNRHLCTVRVRAVNAKGVKGEGPIARVQVTPSPPTVSFGETDDYPYAGGRWESS